MIAFITSAPLLYTDGGWRVVATLYPGLALLATFIPLSIRHAQPTPATARATQFPNTIATSRFEKFLPIALIGFVLISMAYPAVSKFFRGDSKPLSDALILDVRNGETPRWTGLNRAVVAPSDLLNWSTRQGYGSLTAFLTQYGQSILQLRYEEGIYALIAQDTALISDRPELPSAPVFELRRLPQK